MTIEEAKKMFDEIKAQGGNDDEILATLYVLFQKDKLTLDQLEALVNVLGYEFDEEFKNLSPEDKKTKGYADDEESTEATEKEVEEAKEFEGGDESEVESEVTKEKEEKEPEDDEEDEREKAKKLFGFSDK